MTSIGEKEMVDGVLIWKNTIKGFAFSVSMGCQDKG